MVAIAVAAGTLALGGVAAAAEFLFSSPSTTAELRDSNRIFPAMAALPGGGTVVLYGGAPPGAGTPYEDTWVWDGAQWSAVCGTSATPTCGGVGPRLTPGIGPDPIGAVLYGGLPDESFSSPTSAMDDTWRFDGSTWTQLCDGCAPGTRWSAAVAGNGTQVVMFGGGTATPGQTLDDTWIWDGSTWTQLCSAGGSCGPAPRVGGALAWDGTAFVLFGGADQLGPGQTLRTDTWRLVPGGSWVEVCSACAPPARYWAGMTGLTSGARSGVVMGTGFQGSPPSAVADLWFLPAGGSDWEALPYSVGTACGLPNALAMATHSGETMVSFGLFFTTGPNGTLLGAWDRAGWTSACDAIDPTGGPTDPPTTPTPPSRSAEPPARDGGSGDAGTLPRTGGRWLPLTWTGLAATAVGAAMVAAGRQASIERRDSRRRPRRS